jgi:hypothetical protein
MRAQTQAKERAEERLAAKNAVVAHVQQSASEHESRADKEIRGIRREEDSLLSASPGLMRLAQKEGAWLPRMRHAR